MPDRSRPGWLRRALSCLTGAVALSSSPAGATPRVALPPARRPGAPVPWIEPGGFPPPRPLGSPTGAVIHKSTSGRAHPAVHGRPAAGAPVAPLFPRQRPDRRAREIAAAMDRHPSSGPRDHVTVSPGDSLWSIAARVAGPDPAQVARYVDVIYAANRRVVGPDPDLILPGIRLRLPPF